MAGKRGKNIPAWMRRKINNIAIWFYDLSGVGRKPGWEEVAKELGDYLNITIDPATQDDDEVRYLANAWSVPGRVTMQKILKGVAYPPVAEDEPWSLGISASVGIPDDATGAVIGIWQWALLQPFRAPFTIRVARMISKLRWIPEAGGSPTGVVVYAESMYLIALQYAARERYVEAVMDKRGMRSPILDVKLLLEPEVRNAAEKLGLMAEWNAQWEATDDTHQLAEEVLAYAPEVFLYVAKKGQLARGALDINIALANHEEILNRIEQPAREKVESMWALASKMATRHPRWFDLPDAVNEQVTIGLLLSLEDAYKKETLLDWDAPIIKLLEEAHKTVTQ